MTNSRRKFCEKAHFKKPINSHSSDLQGGTIINLLFALIFFGLIGLGVWWVIKSFGQAGQQYTQTMIDTKYTAETVKCQTNLRAIAQNIQIYALSNEGFPPTLEDLVQWSGSTQLFKCPAPDGGDMFIFPVNMAVCHLRMFFYTRPSRFMTADAMYYGWVGRLNCSLLKSFSKPWPRHRPP